jgi:hypothetical protein
VPGWSLFRRGRLAVVHDDVNHSRGSAGHRPIETSDYPIVCSSSIEVFIVLPKRGVSLLKLAFLVGATEEELSQSVSNMSD